MRRDQLRQLSRDALIELATERGVRRPAVLTKAELTDEILKHEPGGRGGRGWLGRARDLLASVVDRGLHLPEAARLLRGATDPSYMQPPPPPLPTVTLAEIYAAQGHLRRALQVLDEVLEREPEHRDALRLRKQFAGELGEPASVSADQPGEPAPASAGEPGEPAPASAGEPGEQAPVSADNAPPERSGSYPIAQFGVDTPPPNSSDDIVVDGEVDVDEFQALESQQPPTLPREPITDAPADSLAHGSIEQRSNEQGSIEQTLDCVDDEPATHKRQARPADEDTRTQERDDLVALATDPHTMYVYWELRAARFAHARWSDPTGELVLRVLTVRIGASDTETATLDEPVHRLVGDRFVTDLPAGAEVRLCLGWKGSKGFVALVVAPEMQLPRDAGVVDHMAALASRGGRQALGERPGFAAASGSWTGTGSDGAASDAYTGDDA